MPSPVSSQLATAAPSFVLSFNGVNFRLSPDQIGSRFSLHHADHERVELVLENFTGSLSLVPACQTLAVTPPTARQPAAVPPTRVSMSPEEKPRKKRVANTKKKKQEVPRSQVSPNNFKPNKMRRVSRDEEMNDTLIDKSRVTVDENEDESMHEISEHHAVSEEDTIETSPEDDTVRDMKDAAVHAQPEAEPDDNSMVRPPPRWGHTMTHLADESGEFGSKCLIYGGQSLVDRTLVTHNDVYQYDFATKLYSRPIHCEGLERQWHSCAYVPKRQLMVAFGGEYHDPKKKGRMTTVNEVMVLDTEIMLWYPPQVTGDLPSARSGHTATMVMDDSRMVVIGGVGPNQKFQAAVAVLDVALWKWAGPLRVRGDAPRPRAYHSATAVKKGQNKEWIVLFGGNNHNACFNNVTVLECNRDTMSWSWINPVVLGDAPAPRTGHSATLLEDGTTILIQGGWDPIADDDDDEFCALDGSFLLDTNTWEWRVPREAPPVLRVGHTALFHDDKVRVFGGRVGGGQFSNELSDHAILR